MLTGGFCFCFCFVLVSNLPTTRRCIRYSIPITINENNCIVSLGVRKVLQVGRSTISLWLVSENNNNCLKAAYSRGMLVLKRSPSQYINQNKILLSLCFIEQYSQRYATMRGLYPSLFCYLYVLQNYILFNTPCNRMLYHSFMANTINST